MCDLPDEARELTRDRDSDGGALLGARCVEVLPSGDAGTPVDLQIQTLWIHNIAISMGLVNSNTTPMLLKLIASGRLNVDNFITHQFKLHDMMDAYAVFGRAAETTP